MRGACLRNVGRILKEGRGCAILFSIKKIDTQSVGINQNLERK